MHRCKPIFAADPQNAIGPAGGDALTASAEQLAKKRKKKIALDFAINSELITKLKFSCTGILYLFAGLHIDGQLED
jgi:hypothetical protein